MVVKALLQQANFTLGSDATLNTEIHKNFGPHKGPTQSMHQSENIKNQINHYNKQIHVKKIAFGNKEHTTD